MSADLECNGTPSGSAGWPMHRRVWFLLFTIAAGMVISVLFMTLQVAIEGMHPLDRKFYFLLHLGIGGGVGFIVGLSEIAFRCVSKR